MLLEQARWPHTCSEGQLLISASKPFENLLGVS